MTDLIRHRIYAIRKLNRLTQEQFANAIGVSRMTVERWESGEVKPYPTNVAQIALTFGFNYNELIGD